MVGSPAPVSACASDGASAPEGLPADLWRVMRSIALASLVPFFLLSLGYYFSLSLVVVDYVMATGVTYGYSRDWIFWDSRDYQTADASAFISAAATIAAVSFVLLCWSVVAIVSASAAINSGRRLTLRESFSRVRRLWRAPPVARLYFTVLFLGYVLSQVAVVVATLVIAGGSLSWSTSYALLSLVTLFLSLYWSVLRSVSWSVLEEGERAVEALWKAGALVEERKLQGLFLFFVALVTIHGFLLMGHGLMRRHLYSVEMEAIRLSLGAVAINTLWMLGACGFFGCVGVLV